jgi:hypothetical protein
MQAAMTPIAQPVRIDMLKSSLDRDRFGCTTLIARLRPAWAAAVKRVM